MQTIHISSDGGQKVNVLGIPMVIRVHGRQTGGQVSVVESHDVSGGGPPPHVHGREDETFQVLEGEYEWTVGSKAEQAAKVLQSFAATLNSLDESERANHTPAPTPRNWWKVQAGRFHDDPTFADFVARVQAARRREG